jgi:hypothetical protein
MTGPVEPKGSPLGRYDPDLGEELFEVRLVNLPLRLLVAGREHHDEVMREFAMMALDESGGDHAPARLRELVDVLGRRYGAVTARPDAEVDAAVSRGAQTIDLVYHVPSHVADAAVTLEGLMAEVDDFCRDRQLLSLERSPLQLRFAHWYLDEFRRQINGEPPAPWDGPLDEA